MPYNHPDAFAFLSALNKKYKPTRIINIGDEIDWHSISFHEHDPNLLAPADELAASIKKLKYLYDLFPEMDLLESNHGSLVYRKGNFMGIPRSCFKSYREMIEAPKDWRWHNELTLELPGKQSCYFHHGKKADGIKLSQSLGMNSVQGHFHEKFQIQYWNNPKEVHWSLQVGCLVDFETYAFNYARNNLHRPILGIGLIIDGKPILEPMHLNENGRWSKRWLGLL